MRKKYNLLDKGEILFKFGVFSLISAPLIGIISIFLSSLLSIITNKNSLFKDKLNVPIFVSLGILTISTLRNLIFFHGVSNRTNLFLEVFNWIPFFLIFLGVPYYLKKQSQREIFSKLIIIGSFPILISSFLQKYFNIYGPFSILNGLIVWYQRRPGYDSSDNITGLFNNPNYTGFILCAIIPFLIFEIIKNKRKPINFIICIIIFGLFLLNIILTQSRNAMLGAFFSIAFVFSFKVILIFIISTLIILPLIFLLGSLLEIEAILVFYNQIINKVAALKFISFLETIRYEIWQKSLLLIFEKPIFGWGGSTFAALYLLKNGIFKIQHAHNLPLQMAQTYGLPFSLLLTSFIVFLIYKCIKIEFKKFNSINKYWTISLFVASFHQLFDVVLYDGRLNIFYCIIIAGSKCIISNEYENKLINSSNKY
tara:strand:+ start:13603 stop:14877 length:1275 start_codon:yes stop_codon:yes gene_type:complete